MVFNTVMLAYSLDLRARIVDAVERQSGSERQIAVLFGVHESFIYKLLRQKRDRGTIAPLPHGGGAHAKLSADQLRRLPDWVAAMPDATLDELREQLKKQARVVVSLSTICRGLHALGLSRKKSPLASQADPQERAAFQEKQKTLAREDLIFVDEFGIHLAMTRPHARAPIGERVTVTEPFKHGSNVSV